MPSVSQVEEGLKTVMEERACVLARQSGCIKRERGFSGVDLLQTLVFGWLTHPDASLETLASTAAIREVYVSDTAVHQRFNESCARFLHAVLEEMVNVFVYAEQPVPLEVLPRFSSVVLEDSSSSALPKELVDCWRGSGGGSGGGEVAIKLHVRAGSHAWSAVWTQFDRWTSVRSAQSLAPVVPARRELVHCRLRLRAIWRQPCSAEKLAAPPHADPWTNTVFLTEQRDPCPRWR